VEGIRYIYLYTLRETVVYSLIFTKARGKVWLIVNSLSDMLWFFFCSSVEKNGKTAKADSFAPDCGYGMCVETRNWCAVLGNIVAAELSGTRKKECAYISAGGRMIRMLHSYCNHLSLFLTLYYIYILMIQQSRLRGK